MGKVIRIKNRKTIELAKQIDQRCVLCGNTNNLTVHHIKTVGAGGDDTLDNLITLCFDCHRKVHDKGRNFLLKKLKTFNNRFNWKDGI